MTRPTQPVVFSDLDGSLLDHDTYEFETARPAIEALRRAAIPLVLVTSKTAAEVMAVRAALENAHPFVVENGAATFIPTGYFDAAAHEHGPGFEIVSAGPSRAQVLAVLERIRTEGGFRFTGFDAMGTQGIAKVTALAPEAAAAANERTASEPLLWQDTEARLHEFETLLGAHGLRCARGGRFVSVGGQFDKGAAVTGLMPRFRHKYPHHSVESIALGDGPNDLTMLACADTAVVIRGRHGHDMPLPASARVMRTSLAGPAGWNDAILSLLDSGRPG